MDSETQDLLSQKLTEAIYDEDKIVTLTSTMNMLNIDAQEATKLLTVIVNDHRQSKSDELAVTFAITGLSNTGELKVILAKEENLPDIKTSFKTISSENIYSIQKHKNIDANSISLVDGFNAYNPENTQTVGLVTSKNCIKRVIKQTKQLPPIRKEPVIKGKSAMFMRSTPSEKPANNSNSETKGNNKKPNSQNKAVSKPKSNQNIAGFFVKSQSSTQNSKDIEVKKAEASENKVELNSEETSEISADVAAAEINGISIKDVDNQITKQEQKVVAKTKSNKNKRRRSNGKNTDQPTKRRKRIVQLNDSDSDDIFASDEDDELENNRLADSEEESQPWIIQSQPQPVELPPMNKKRKLVDKTYEDEDGFILTKKEWVYESASDDEKEQEKPNSDSNIPKVEVAKPTKTENSKPVILAKKENTKGKKLKKTLSGNQPTLMNFFKKS